MKKFTLICFISLVGLLAMACERNGVQASNESDVYQPRPVREKKFYSKYRYEMKGELVRVDLPAKTVALQIENGLVQTFKFDENTSVTGLGNQPQTGPLKLAKTSNGGSVANLVGKEGSEVTVRWKDRSENKLATKIRVDQIHIAKPVRRGRLK
jgi:hypothetical protein